MLWFEIIPFEVQVVKVEVAESCWPRYVRTPLPPPPPPLQPDHSGSELSWLLCNHTIGAITQPPPGHPRARGGC